MTLTRKNALRLALVLWAVLCFAGLARAGEVGRTTAHVVARNWLTHCVEARGSWAGSRTPTISGEEIVEHEGRIVGYNFLVSPRGHILVPVRDELPAVKLYSDTSTLSIFDPAVREQSEWIAGELFKLDRVLDSNQVRLERIDAAQTINGRLWAVFAADPESFVEQYKELSGTAAESLSVGPLLSTTWAQGDPYNLQCPEWYNGSCRTIVGCVATAASQIMKFWNHPDTGSGSVSYGWYNGSTAVTLSRDFSQSTYDWANMPNALYGSSTAAQKNAVARLCADVGIAFQMYYGCSASGANTLYGATVFPTYFGYKDTIQTVYRTSYATSSAWMQVFKAEVQAGRPSQLRIRSPDAGGHSIVVDGYRDSQSEQIHLNMGWAGNYNGWYVSDNFTTGSYTWSDWDYQAAVIKIEPEGPPCPVPDAPGTLTCPDVDEDGSFTVSWASVTDATSYTLQRATDVNFLQNNVTLYIGTSTGYSQTGLADGTYYYRVKADNACGSSTWRTGPALTVTAVTELVNGQSVAVSVSKDENKYYRINVPSGATRLDIGLTNVSGDPDLYTRYNEPPTISTYECRPFAGTGISETCTTDSPSPGDWYIMIVGFSSASATLTAAVTVPCVGPAAPGSISYPSTDADGGFTVSWSASSGATGYTLQRATNANFSDAQTVYSGASTSYSQTGLASGTYYYRVNASNNCGTSTWTAGPAIVVCIPPAAPGSIIYPSVNAGGGFTVSWGSSGLAAAYTLERAGNSSFTGASTAYSGPLTSYSQTGLNPGTYYFRVNAMNQCGVSAWTAGGAARVVRNVVSALAPMLLNDTDNDGIPDDVENTACTDANNPDTDGDGIPDGVEDANKNGVLDSGETNPCDDDTDDDGIEDGVEDANRNGLVDEGETDPRTSDTDGDGLPDAWEVRYSLNPRVDDCNEDPDGDGFTNCQEYPWGSNPRDASSHPPKGLPWMNLILD